ERLLASLVRVVLSDTREVIHSSFALDVRPPVARWDVADAASADRAVAQASEEARDADPATSPRAPLHGAHGHHELFLAHDGWVVALVVVLAAVNRGASQQPADEGLIRFFSPLKRWDTFLDELPRDDAAAESLERHVEDAIDERCSLRDNLEGFLVRLAEPGGVLTVGDLSSFSPPSV